MMSPKTKVAFPVFSEIVTPKHTRDKKYLMTQKTEIEFELSETIAYSRRGERIEAICPHCKTVVEMATPQLAAILMRTSEREIFRQVETGRAHFIETNRVLVCLNSLTNYQKES